MIELQEHYGAKVYTDIEADQMRRERCLCWKCDKLKPGQPDNCNTAHALYKICKTDDIATMVTRCREFQSKK